MEEIRYWRSEKEAALEKCQTTEKLVEEFQFSKPMFDENQRLKQELEQTTRDNYKLELYHERLWKRKEEEIEWSISEIQLDRANRELVEVQWVFSKVQSTNPNNLKEMVMDLFHNPNNYIDTIMRLMEQYDLEHEKRRKEN